MIRSFRHRGLRRFYASGDARGIPAEFVRRVRLVLADLDAAQRPQDLALPGYRLHPLRGEWKGFWAVQVSGNWRVVFRIDEGEVLDVDLVDYH